MRERLNSVPPWLPVVQLSAVTRSQGDGKKWKGGRECCFSCDRTQEAAFPQFAPWLGGKMTWEKASSFVLSLGLSLKPPYVLPESLLCSHNRMGWKLRTDPVNPQHADRCPSTVSAGAEWHSASYSVHWFRWSGIAKESYPVERHQQFGSSVSLTVDQKGMPDPTCGCESLKLHHFTFSKVETMKDFLI